MRTKRDFYNQVNENVKEGLKTLQGLSAQIREAEQEMKSGKYSVDYINSTLNPKLKSLRKEMEAVRREANEKVQTMCDEYMNELRAQDDLDPALLTDDVKLLQAGVKLNKRDIKAMLRRNAENHTMLQVILRYCNEHDIDTDGVRFIGNRNIIDNVSVVPSVVDTSLKWCDRESSVYNQLMGEGSNMDMFFRD